MSSVLSVFFSVVPWHGHRKQGVNRLKKVETYFCILCSLYSLVVVLRNGHGKGGVNRCEKVETNLFIL